MHRSPGLRYASPMSGHSGTPLARKPGIRDGFRLVVIGAPEDYPDLLAPLPPAVEFATAPDASTNLVHLFTRSRTELTQALPRYRRTLAANAVVWISRPKKSSKVPTEVTEDVVRELALPLGLVDVKVCAVDDLRSGLKLVVRKALR